MRNESHVKHEEFFLLLLSGFVFLLDNTKSFNLKSIFFVTIHPPSTLEVYYFNLFSFSPTKNKSFSCMSFCFLKLKLGEVGDENLSWVSDFSGRLCRVGYGRCYLRRLRPSHFFKNLASNEDMIDFLIHIT